MSAGDSGWTKRGLGHDDLAVMDADGSDFTVLDTLRKEATTYYDPVWSPTGRIFFTRTGGKRRGAVCSVNPDGSGLADVTVLPAGSEGAAFLNAVFSLSQDGRWLALVDLPLSATMGGSRIGFMAANGHGREHMFLLAKRLATLRGEDRLEFRRSNHASWFIGTSCWSPDGTRIAFIGGATFHMGNASALYVVGVDGSGLRKVPNTGGVMSPAWQPQ